VARRWQRRFFSESTHVRRLMISSLVSPCTPRDRATERSCAMGMFWRVRTLRVPLWAAGCAIAWPR